MIEPPFKIFYQNRPLRICYLLDINNSTINNVLEIMNYCCHLWGGKDNPIIFTDGMSISNEDLKFLKVYDPDVIKSYILLDSILVNLLEIELSPFEIEVPRDNETEITPITFKRHVEYLMSSSLIKDFTNDLIPPTLSLFSYDSQTKSTLNENIINFIKINFGIFNNTLFEQLSLKDTPHEIITLSDETNFIKDFKNIINWNRRLFQNQFACYTNYQIEPVDYRNIYSHFSIIIGDSIKELTYFWNENFFKRHGHFPKIRSLWIPYEISVNPNYSDIIKDFIRFYSTSVNGSSTIKFISFTLEEDKLKELGNNFTKDLFVHREFEKKESLSLPELKNYQYYHNIKTTWKYFNATSKDATFEVNLPKSIQNPSNYLSWGVDIAIEYKSSRFKNFSEPEYWLQLPKRNWVSVIQNQYSRITNHFYLSTILSGSKPNISITIYNDFYIFKQLLTNRHYNYYPTNDPRNQLKKELYEDVIFSNNGSYLQGIIELFKGLYTASQYLKESFWRSVFDKMSNRVKLENQTEMDNIEKDVRSNMTSLIKDHKLKGNEIESLPDRMIEFMSKRIYNATKNNTKTGIELTFNILKDIADEEAIKFTKQQALNSSEVYTVDDKDLKRQVNELLYYNILLMGILPSCPRCGIKNWINLNEIKYKLECFGCKSSFLASAEETWFYKLNTLFEMGFSRQGLCPVILVLGQLLMESRSSFLYTASLDIFEERDDSIYNDKKRESVTDLDIVCIVDGEFIIGEIKQNNKLFIKKDFDTMYNVAVRIKPDKIIFSSLSEQPSESINKNIAELREKLKQYKIKVEWYPLNTTIFEPSWVR